MGNLIVCSSVVLASFRLMRKYSFKVKKETVKRKIGKAFCHSAGYTSEIVRRTHDLERWLQWCRTVYNRFIGTIYSWALCKERVRLKWAV